MAIPIIDNIQVVPSVIAPGETAVLTITAHDPDSQVGLLTGTVTDLAGNVKAAQVSLTVQDILSYALEDTDGVGFTIIQRPAEPNVFDITAP